MAGWRDRFPILGRCTYLVNNSLGAMPASVPDSLADYAAAWAERGVEAWTSDWLPELRRTADLLGSLMGAPPGTVVVHQNVATLTEMVLSALPRDPARLQVVLGRDEWPSHRYLVTAHERLGLEPLVVPAEQGVEGLLDSVDERTLLVILSHVRFRDATINDLGAVVDRAHAVGALVLGDGYHAVGHMPVDVVALGVDAYVGGSVKWLCGGPGVGWLYLRPETQAVLLPGAVGWLGHARPFDFSGQWEAAEGAMGWLGGTPGMPALYAAREGYRAIAEVTPARIRATSERLTATLVESSLNHGFTVRTPLDPARRAGTVTLDVGERTAEVAAKLIASGILVDYRPDAGIRVGAHFFNTVEECLRLVETMEKA